jgi:hypothetical protein
MGLLVHLAALASVLRAVSAIDGIWQLQPTNDMSSTPPVVRSSVHVRHCSSVVFATPYATSGPKDDFRWKFEDALNGASGAVSIRVTTDQYTDRYISNICDDPAGLEPTRACTSVPKADKDSYSFRVESGLCNPGYYSFVSLGKATSGYYLGINDKLQGPCGSQYQAPGSDVVFLTPAEANARPQSATWMLVDSDDLSGSYNADCGGMWGITVLLVVGLGSLVYVVGGIAYGRRTKGSSGPPLEAHPHYIQWQEVHALTMDGMAFSRGRLQGRRTTTGGARSGGYERLSASSSGGKSHARRPEREETGANEERSPSSSRPSAKISKSSKHKSEKSDREPSGKKKGSKEKSSDVGRQASATDPDGGREEKATRDSDGRLLQEVREDGGMHASQAKIKVKSLLG